MNNKFELKSKYQPEGDQPQAIHKLLNGLKLGKKHQILLGVTGSGKTFTMANVIAQNNKPTLVIAHNKTLAAQLTTEYRQFFPNNAVEYFVSYYDYYQPEAYIPHSDTYIEKEAMINDEIDRLRHEATQALMTRKDVIIVASVSCIYGIGSSENYGKSNLYLSLNTKFSREKVVSKLIQMQFNRNDLSLKRGSFRIKGSILEIMPIHIENIIRIDFENDHINSMLEYNPIDFNQKKKLTSLTIFSAKHYVVSDENLQKGLDAIEQEMLITHRQFLNEGKIIEAERLKRRTNYDLELIREVGYCNGIENYSRHLDGRKPGEAPETLLSYFPDDFLLIVDESHVTIPQIRGMFAGDLSRKNTLIEHGFRLPSARDNRPLNFQEFEKKINQVIYTSATPSTYELEHSESTVEQIIRPTGLIDPQLIIKPAQSQIEDLIDQIQKVVAKNQRVLVTTLTKKTAEDLAQFLTSKNISGRYLHSSIDTIERIKILQQLRQGEFNVLVGVNLLREGLDLPEVSLVAILDADKEGFLRSEKSLIQTIGRAARNIDGKVLLYCENISESMQKAIDETNRRRKIQLTYNKKHNITPKSIQKAISSIADNIKIGELEIDPIEKENADKTIQIRIKRKKTEMERAAKNLQFELAAVLRDEINALLKIQNKIEKFK